MGTTIVILGGYGNTGRRVAEGMLRESTARVVIAGRDGAGAARFAESLCLQFGDGRARGIVADASNAASLRDALRGAAMVVVASSTARYAGTVAEAALDAGCDYLDVNYSRAKYAALEALRSRVEISGRCFITDAGFHPGLPAALVRRAASMLDSIETANVVSLIQMDWRGLDLRPATIEEFAAELAEYDSRYYRDGEWRKASLWSTKDFRKADFGPPFGTRQCAPMFFEELRELPERFPTLREAGFFIAGFNPVTDFLIMPLTIIAYRISPRTLGPAAARLMYWALRRFSKPPFETLLRVDATGPLNGQPTSATITLRHPDGYVMTAVPVVACLLQWLDGTTRTPGIHTMGNLVEPERLLRDMVRMGVPVDARIVAGVRYRQNA